MRLLTILSTIILLFSCSSNDKEEAKANHKITTYISAYTGGVISNQSTIRIEFRETHNNIKINEVLEDNPFSFSPSVDGEAVWIDGRTLEFRPSDVLKSNQLYETTFKTGEIISIPEALNIFEFSFNVKPLFYDINFDGIAPYTSDNMTWQKLNGSIITTDFVNAEIIEKSTDLEGIGSSFSWSHDSNGKTHHFTIDSIQREDFEKTISITLDGKIINTRSEELEIIIPALGDFKVMSQKVFHSPSQFISLIFSAPVKKDLDLSGLIYFQTGQEIRLIIDGNQIKVYPQSRITGETVIIVTKGINNVMGYALQEAYSETVNFHSTKPSVQLLGDGVIVPSNDGIQFPFKAVSLSAIHVRILKVYENNINQFFQLNNHDGQKEMKRVGRVVYSGDVNLNSNKVIDHGKWNNFSLDLAKFIETEPGAIYRVELSMKKSQSTYPCDKDESDDTEALSEEIFAENEADFYDSPGNYYYYGDAYYYSKKNYKYIDRENPCKLSYFLDINKMVSRNIIASDYGIIAKKTDNQEYQFIITDLKTALPISGIDLEIRNLQGLVIGTTQTNSDGIGELKIYNKAFLLVAKKGLKRGYLRLDDGNALSYSMFDVDGAKNKKGIKGFIYGDRGVWRPGDSLFISFILEDKNLVLPENHPVIFELEDARGNIIERKVSHTGVNGFYDFRIKTEQDAPTGNWLARVKVGANTYTKYLKIENIKPNRLKILAEFDNDLLLNDTDNNGTLEVKWLHGAKAKLLKTDIEVQLSAYRTTFEGYKGYQFDDPSRSFHSTSEKIFEGNLDEDGVTNFIAKFNIGDNAPGMLRAKFKVRAFEKSGDFSVDRFNKRYSPYTEYVGIKIPEGQGWRGALMSDQPNIISIATLTADGQPVNKSNLRLEIYKLDWRWWWESNSDDYLSKYINNQERNLIYSADVTTSNGKALHEINFDKSYWGRAYVRIVDSESGHAAGKLIYLDYSGWWDDPHSDKPGGAEMLTFSTDKDEYIIGDEVIVNFPSSENSRALVSLESGSKIIKTLWIDCKKGTTSFQFEVEENMAPNIYVNISMIQPHKQTVNDLPIRLYGIQSIKVKNPNTFLHPVIDMDDVLAPEKPVRIVVTEKEGKKMTFTIAVVDDGLLDLTRFRTPDPHKHFYQKAALGVKTFDMYKYVMGAFSGEMSGLLELGGDEEGSASSKKNAIRFKPVVKFFGPFSIEAQGSKVIEFIMPNYVGSVRTYVVAGDNGAYGNSQKTTPVRQPLMVLTTLPRVIGPGEKVNIPVTVFAMEEDVKKVTINLEHNELFTVIGSSKKTIEFTEIGDQVVNFEVLTKNALGIGKISVIAKSGKHRASDDQELNVRVANPRITHTESINLTGGESDEMTYELIGMTGTNKLILEASTIPPLNLGKRLKYLIQYPHGCVEQTTSSVFPQLYISDLLELDSDKQVEIKNNINAGITMLSKFQLSNGGLSYWPYSYNNDASEWGTNYAGHFLIEAQNKGYKLPNGLLKNWIKFQKQMANDWNNFNTGNRHDNIQAYRLYTLALAGEPVLGAMNRLRNDSRISNQAKWRLAAAYALAGKEKIAQNILANLSTQVEAYNEFSYSYGSKTRDLAMILETTVLLEMRNESFAVLQQISDAMGSDNWYSTQTTAYSLLAVGKFAQANGSNEEIQLEVNIDGEILNVNSNSAMYQYEVDVSEHTGGIINFNNQGNSTVFIRLQSEGIPLEDGIKKEDSHLQMNVKYYDLADVQILPEDIKQGTDFKVKVSIKNSGLRADYKDLALTQIFPSGWEIRNMRMDEWNVDKGTTDYDYQDIRDDRVNYYFGLKHLKIKTFEVYLHAAYIGEYYLPAVYCEAMYDREIHSTHPGRWIKVSPLE